MNASYPKQKENDALIDLLSWMDFINESHLAGIEADQQKQLITEQEAKFGARILKIGQNEKIYDCYTDNKVSLEEAQKQSDMHIKLISKLSKVFQ